MADELLRVEGLCAGYGASQVLEHLSFSMGHESVTIVGRNGMGKTTLCNTLMGLLKSSAGAVTFAGDRIDGLNPEQVARRGIAYIPQGRRLFPSLSVDEHLAMLAKGTRVNGVFDKDPLKFADAIQYETIDYTAVLSRSLANTICVPLKLQAGRMSLRVLVVSWTWLEPSAFAE